MVTPHIERVTGAVASFNSDYNKIPVKSLICNIEPIQEGTGDPSPENVRAIRGRTVLKLWKTGKNLLDTKLYDGISYNPTIGTTVNPVESADVLTDKGYGEFQLSFTRTWKQISFIVPVVKGISYNVYCKFTTDSNVATSYGLLDENYTVLSRYNEGVGVAGSITKDLTFGTDALPTDRGYFYLLFTNRTVANAVIDISKPQLELGSTATDYEPYQGETVPINLETEAGTVYGGYVNVVSGKLVVDYKYYENAGVGNWSSTNTGGNRYLIGGITTDALNNDTTGWCNIGALVNNYYATGVSISSNGSINLCGDLYSAFASVDALKAYLAEHPLQLVYKLATPTEIQLTPQEIRTLLDVNNIWCDSGEATVDYWKWGK